MKVFNRRKHKVLRKNLRNNGTKAEKLFWYKVSGKKLGVKFRRQHGIGNYIADFYCPELKLAVEIDGATHEMPEELKRDKEKEEFFKQSGITIKRYLNVEIKNGLGAVLEDLENLIKNYDQLS